MKNLTSIFFATLIAFTLTAAGYIAVDSLLDYTPRVEAAPTYMGEYLGHNVTCSEKPRRVINLTTNLRSTCAKASFTSTRRDPENRNRCLKTAFFGSASLYSWGMTFNVKATLRSSYSCLRPA